MKKVRNVLSLVLALLLAMSVLAGCGSSEVPSGKVEPLDNEATTEATTEATEAAATEKEFSIGAMEGGVYTNTYMGIRCTLDSDWVFRSAEELQELPEDMAELFEGTQAGDAMEQYAYIADMMAENATQLTSINLNYVRIPAAERMTYALMSHEKLIDVMLDGQYDAMVSSYAAAGITVSSMEKVTVTFLGESRPALYMVAECSGMPYYTLQIMDYSLGQYGATLTVASFNEDRTESLLALFTPVE